MLKRMSGLPAGVHGVRAGGKLTRADYDEVMIPLLDEIEAAGGDAGLVVQLGPELDEVGAGAAWEDFRLTPRYLSLIARCAIVTEIDWLRRLSKVLAAVWPKPLRWFANDELEEAVRWAAAQEGEGPPHHLDEESGVLLIEPRGRLAPEDFDAVAATVDPWLEAGHELEGVVIRAESFPEWESLAAFVKHVRFVKDHHRRVKRVALVAGGTLAPVLPKLGERFVAAELEHFEPGDFRKALDWVKGA